MAETENLALPCIEAGQAQKHITHNEALRLLDIVVQLAVANINSTPPGSPAAGERRIVGASPSGAFAGQTNKIAAYQNGGWIFVSPKPGWRAWNIAADKLLVWSGSAWNEFVSGGGGGGSYQPLDSDLTAIAGLSTQSFGRGLLEIANAGASQAYIGVRETLTANRTYYVRTADGSDSNNGLANNSGGAFATLAKAVAVVASLDRSIYDVTIQVGNGTYTSGISVTGWGPGSGAVSFIGDTTTPSNVTISTTASTAIQASGPNARLNIAGFKVQTATSGQGIAASSGAEMTVNGNMDFGACASGYSHVSATSKAVINLNSNYTISGSAAIHINCGVAGAISGNSRTITLSGTPAFSFAFAAASNLSLLIYHSMTFSGSATGSRYNVSSNSVMFTNGAGANYFPGNSAGSSSTGGAYT